MEESIKIVNEYGDQYWKNKAGRLHRDGDLPAVVYLNGSQKWYKNGQHHRDGDLPAIVYWDGSQEWYKNGLQHRDGDLPAYIGSSGSGTQLWYKDGKIHRIYGPAEMWPSRSRTSIWSINLMVSHQ